MKLTKDLEDINKGLSVFAYLSLDSDKSVCYFFFYPFSIKYKFYLRTFCFYIELAILL